MKRLTCVCDVREGLSTSEEGIEPFVEKGHEMLCLSQLTHIGRVSSHYRSC
jgi:hypothetical protein